MPILSIALRRRLRKEKLLMNLYSHFSIDEREKMLKLRIENKGVREIARRLNRSASSVSRELKRNSVEGEYSAVNAQREYLVRRQKCQRQKLLDNRELKEKIKELFLECSWSPEQICNRLAHEDFPFKISYTTIYRGIYEGIFDGYLPGNKKATRKLRHRGKTRKRAGVIETRGKISIPNTIHERPIEANERKVMGHWEADTMAGKTGSSCLLTLTDMSSRYLLAGRIPKKKSTLVKDKMVELLSPVSIKRLRSVTPDRGKEFARHEQVTKILNGLKFYFCDPHSPWQRGTNENTNGLLREYLPKGTDMSQFTDHEISDFIDKINKRPRKCLGWMTPHEVFFSEVLHLT